jgi:iron complex outermembrane recepter protein
MKTSRPFAACAWLLALATSAPLNAQASSAAASTTAQTGTVNGRIQNAATGQSLNNARVTVRGTGRVVFTDESGTYLVPSVPAGSITLQFFFTGLDPQEITLQVAAGQSVERNVDLTNAARYGDKDGTIKLDAFTVGTTRDTNADSIATNEQRFAANIKNVISADAFGEVTDGNVGEFLKFLPGITAEYDAESGSSVSSVAVRGFPTSMAVVSGDGMQMANTGNPTGSSRVFQFTQVSMNNLARLEVTKVPTPSTPPTPCPAPSISSARAPSSARPPSSGTASASRATSTTSASNLNRIRPTARSR